MANEIKRLYFGFDYAPVEAANVEEGTYTLSFGGYTTSDLDYNANAATVQTALEGLTSIGSGNVGVTGNSNGFTITFQGALADTDVGALTCTPSLKQKADTVSVTTTTNGAVDTYSAPSTGDSFTDGNDDLVFAQQVITFTPSPTQGSWTFDGNSRAWNEDFSGSPPSGWMVSGIPGSGSVTITKTTSTSGQSPFSYSVGTLEYLSASGAYQVVNVALTDGPTEGNLNVTLDGSTSNDFTVGASAQTITGWTEGGTGPWTYTRNTFASNVSTSGAEGSTPLRKSCTVTITVEQEGTSIPNEVDTLAGTPGVESIEFTWTPPSPAYEGETISKYTLYLNGVLHTDEVTSPHEVTGLTGGVESGPWTVTSTNAVGESDPSNSVSETPLSPPSASEPKKQLLSPSGRARLIPFAPR
jgi:hypothetical protein